MSSEGSEGHFIVYLAHYGCCSSPGTAACFSPNDLRVHAGSKRVNPVDLETY